MLFSQEHLTGTSFLQIISASLTPAILILATGSLVNSTLTRLGRIVDRARVLMDRMERERHNGIVPGPDEMRFLRTYARRAALAERALTMYYAAIGFFVASSLVITIDRLTRDSVPWLSLALVTCGAILLFSGTAALVIETNMATGILREEIERAGQKA